MKNTEKETQLYGYLLAIGFLISVFSVYFTQAEDMGIFLTVSSLLTKGYRLYSEIFEMKDPIFFYSSAGMMKVFGLRGAFLIDVMLITISPIVSYLALRNLDFKKEISFTSSILFTLALTGTFYQPFRTQILGIILLVLALALSGRNNFVVGILLSIILFTKMGFLVFSPIILAIVYFRSKTLKINVIKVAAGFILHSVFLVGIMQVRGEFSGYLSMVKTNFYYASNVQKMFGLPEGIKGHLKIWNAQNQSLAYFAFSLFLILALLKIHSLKSLSKIQLIATALVNFLSFVFLMLTNLWVHHLQILALSSLINFAVVIQIFASYKNLDRCERKFEIEKQDTKKGIHNKTILEILIFTLALMCVAGYSGATIPTKPKMNLEKWIIPNWTVPPEIIALNSVQPNVMRKIRVARLGQNDDLGYGAFLNTKKFEFICNRPGFVGFEPISELKTFLICMTSNVDVLTIGPLFDGVDRPYGSYNWFKSEAKRILAETYDCNLIDASNYRICLRKKGI